LTATWPAYLYLASANTRKVTVYGLAGISTTSGGVTTTTTYVSTLSPILNPISNDVTAVPAKTSLAASANADGTINYLYYLTQPE
jgi:hypothetical protein